jgi:RND family efflux transporter MFP subunit
MPERNSATRTRRGAWRAASGAPMLLLLAIAMTSGCAQSTSHHGAAVDAAEPLTVGVVRPGGGGDLEGLILPGRVKAREEVTLASRITARLTTLPIREGGVFHKGQVLARFDAPETRDALQSAREAVDATRSRLEQTRIDEERARTLFASNVAARRDVEVAGVERHAAEAAFSNAQATLQSWQENAALTAPFDGVVARRHVDPGQTLAPGQPILDLRSRAVGEIEAAVPESALPALTHSAAAIQLGDGPWIDAALLRVDGMTDPRTRTRLAYFAPRTATALEAGAYARVRVTIVADSTGERGGDTGNTSSAISVPSRSLVHRGALTGVFVLRDGRAWLRWLRVGRTSDGRTEVLAGLTTEDVVAATPEGLADGLAVRVAE